MTYGRQALLGMVFVAAGVVATKFSSFIAQFALGWLLTPDDYTTWGMLVSLRMFVEGIRHGGALPVVLQQRTKTADESGPYFQYALAANILSCLVLVAAAPLAQRFFRTSDLIALAALVAMTFPLSTPGAFYRAQLTIDLRFSAIARIVSIVAAVNYSVMVLCAALGMGPYAFVVPMVVTALAEWWLYARAAERRIWGGRLTQERLWNILRASKWMMVAASATAVAAGGDYLVIGRFAPDLLGEYLFGFQLIVAISAVIAVGFQQVLLPTYAKLQDERRRFAGAYQKSLRLTALAAAPLFSLGTLLAPFAVHFLWAGKWDAAIPVVQAMLLCLVVRLLNPLSASVLQAVGRWDLYAALMAIDALVVVAAAWIGTQIGGVREIAVAVSLGKSMVVIVVLVAAARQLELSSLQVFATVAGRIVLPVAAVLAVWTAGGFPGDRSWQTFAAGLLLLAIASGITLWVYRRDLRLFRALTPVARLAPSVSER